MGEREGIAKRGSGEECSSVLHRYDEDSTPEERTTLLPEPFSRLRQERF